MSYRSKKYKGHDFISDEIKIGIDGVNDIYKKTFTYIYGGFSAIFGTPAISFPPNYVNELYASNISTNNATNANTAAMSFVINRATGVFSAGSFTGFTNGDKVHLTVYYTKQ